MPELTGIVFVLPREENRTKVDGSLGISFAS